MSRGDWPSAAGTRSTLTPPDTSTTSARDNNSCIFLVPPFPRVLRSGGELCDITWGLRQEDLGGIDLRRRGPTRESAPTSRVANDPGCGGNRLARLSPPCDRWSSSSNSEAGARTSALDGHRLGLSVALQALQLVRVHRPKQTRGEEFVQQSFQTARLEHGVEAHARAVRLRLNREGGPHVVAFLDQHTARLSFADARGHRPGAAAERDAQADDGTVAHAAAQDLLVGEGRRQEPTGPMVAGVVRQAAIDDVGGCVDEAFGREVGFHFAGLPVPYGTCTAWYTDNQSMQAVTAPPRDRLLA